VHQPPADELAVHQASESQRRTSADTAAERSTLQTRRVFIVGNSRSGTTMLAHMLGRHSAMFTFQELHFAEELWLPGKQDALAADDAEALADRLLHNQRAWYHTTYSPGQHRDVAREIVLELPEPLTATGVFAAVLAHETEAAGKQIAVEQTPRNVFYLRQLLERLPDSRAVVLTRDSRDVLLSQKNWWRRRFRGTSDLPWRTTVRQWADYHPLTTSLIWRGGVRAGLGVSEHPGVTMVRFEDLVRDPEGVLTSLLGDLGLEFEESMLDVERISSSNSGDRAGVGVDPSVVGQFRKGLSSAEIWVNQRITASESAQLGYEPVTVRPSAPALAVLALLWPIKLALAVALNAGRSRSLLTSVRKRLKP
jgi:omega-hydroxy-beta-dihydromenaquinone-9 sulfotransferase